MDELEEVMSLEGPVLKVNGELMLFIPLVDGASDLADSRSTSEVQREYLKIVIPEWLAEMLQIEEGDLICVHNGDNQFRILASQPRLVH
jgi:hypothetical protein